MMESNSFNLEDLTLNALYDLRDYINCSQLYDTYTKQQLMDEITKVLRDKTLSELMQPLIEEFIAEQKEKNNVKQD